MTGKPELIFDLDGTLIDSAAGVLSSLATVLDEAGITPRVPFSHSLIGPPLQETLSILTGVEEPQIIRNFVESFKRRYDTGGYRQTTVYPGVPELLTTLNVKGYALHIATNKRLLPTRLILDHFGWSPMFQSVYALDMYEPRLPDKGALLKHLLDERGLRSTDALYIGDKLEDGLAAEQNHVEFFSAAWGYGEFDASCEWARLDSPGRLLERLSDD